MIHVRTVTPHDRPARTSTARTFRPRTLCGALALGAGVLVACGKDIQGPDPDAITVAGTVVDEYLQPQASVGVLIPGHDLVITDEDGRFSISGVSRPYDLVAGLLAERGAMIYARLTRADPLVLVPADLRFSSPHEGGLSGEVSGGVLPHPDDYRTSVFFESPEAARTGSVNGSYHYTLAAQWLGPTTTTGTFHALQWRVDPATQLPMDYPAYGTGSDVAVTVGPLGARSIALTSTVEAGAVSGSVSVPDGYGLSAVKLLAGFGSPPTSTISSAGWELLTDSSGASTFTYVTPNLPGATFTLSARAVAAEAYTQVDKAGLGSNASGVALTLPAPPSLHAPADGLSGVPTQFVWGSINQAVYLLSIRYADPDLFFPAPPNFYVFTTDTVTTLPDLRAFGLTTFRGTSYVWQVRAWAPIENVDAITEPTWFLPHGDRTFAITNERRFTLPR